MSNCRPLMNDVYALLSPDQRHCLQGIGIRRWVIRTAVSDATTIITDDTVTKEAVITETKALPMEPEIKPSVIDQPLNDHAAINRAIQQCQSCQLAQHCSQKVPGVGNQQAGLMIVGEGPGHDEDIKGEPFVGRSGRLLDKMLAAIGINRAEIFITNIVKCRPPNNRDPLVDEVQACAPFLQAQIKQIKPKVILSVGRVSAHNLLRCSSPVGRLIQSIHQLPESDIPVKVTYHPAYLLRTPSAKAIAWQDMKTLHRILQQ